MKKKFFVFALIMIMGLAGCTEKSENNQREFETEVNIENNDKDNISNEEAVETIAPKTEEGKEYYVAAALSVRALPNTTSDILDVLSVNDKIIVYEITDGWAKINYADMDAYVSSKYLSNEPVEIIEQESVDKTEDTEIVSEETATENTESPVATGNMAIDILNLLNAYRQENGLSALTMTDALNGVAQIRAAEASQYWSHTRPDGRDLVTVFQEAGIYGNCAENLAYGCNSAEEFMEGWKASSSHNATMLNGNYSKVGIAIYQDSFGRIYAAQEFQG